MRSHAKAPTAGPTQRQANGLGHIVRGAFATRSAPSDTGGSGAPSHKRARTARLALFALSVFAFTIVLGAAIASAALTPHKQVIDWIYDQPTAGTLGGELNAPHGVAVNRTNGRIFVLDSGNERIQRFNAAGDFELAWGKNVVQTGGSGDTVGGKFEICTVASQCQAGEVSGENGALETPAAIAVDGDTGNVYVSDLGNFRIDEYSEDGGFIRAFGWDVVESGPDEAGTGYEICRQAEGDVCKAGLDGAGTGQLGNSLATVLTSGIAISQPDGNAAAGTVYLADTENSRVNTYKLDGTSPASFGSSADFGSSQPRRIAVDSNGIVYAGDSENGAQINRYDTGSDTFLAPILAVNSTPTAGPLLEGTGESTRGLAVDDEDHLYVLRSPSSGPAVVQEFDAPGEAVAPSVESDHHGEGAKFGNGPIPFGLAVNGANGRLFVSQSQSAEGSSSGVYILDYVEVPEATIQPVTSFDATSADFEGEVVSSGPPHTDYRFEVSSDGGTSWQCASKLDCADPTNLGPIAGETPEAVSGHTDLLAPDTDYIARLAAVKVFGAATGTSAPTPTFHTPAIPPTLVTGYVAPRGLTTAHLTGAVNPNGNATEIHFEYGSAGDCESHPCQSTPAQSAGSEYINPDSGQPLTALSADLSNLQPGTTYHYRLVGSNGVGGSAHGVDRTFRTLAQLAGECPNEDIRSARHTNYLPDCRGLELVNRPDKGPQHVTIEPFNSRDGHPFSRDGDNFIWTTLAGAPGGASGTYVNFLAQRGASGWESQTPVPPAPVQVGHGSLKYILEATSENFSQFIYRTEEAGFLGGLARGTYVRINRAHEQEVLATFQNTLGNTSHVDISADGTHVLHVNKDRTPPELEDIGDPGAAEIISLMPDESEPVCGVDVEYGFISGQQAHTRAGLHWVSADGSRTYFQARSGDCFNGPLGLYVRIREGAGAETQKIADDASFISTTPSGRTGYFTSSKALTAQDVNSHYDVYRWDEGGGLTCLTCVVPDAAISDGPSGPPQLVISDDFSHIYFESQSQIIPGKGTAGHRNVYVLSGGGLHFALDLGTVGELGADASLSTEGNVLTFTSRGQLTSDQLAAECEELHTHAQTACEEVYRYDDRDGSLECLSCLHGSITTGLAQAANRGQGPAFRTSADGSTVAFMTPQSLLPGDVNGALDLYEWRDGVVGLLTDGVTEYAGDLGSPLVFGVDSNGSNVFFRVADPGLTGFEGDGVDNLYDARIDGGFEPPVTIHCAEESCQGPVQPAPVSEHSASSSFSGRGNLAAQSHKAPCARKRGTARKRCIRKRHRQAKKNPRQHRNARGGK